MCGQSRIKKNQKEIDEKTRGDRTSWVHRPGAHIPPKKDLVPSRAWKQFFSLLQNQKKIKYKSKGKFYSIEKRERERDELIEQNKSQMPLKDEGLVQWRHETAAAATTANARFRRHCRHYASSVSNQIHSNFSLPTSLPPAISTVCYFILKIKIYINKIARKNDSRRVLIQVDCHASLVDLNGRLTLLKRGKKESRNRLR